MSRLGLVLVIGAMACAKSNSIVCEDGTYCPIGTTCVVVTSGTICATPDQTKACAGKSDNDACANGASTGYCANGACIATSCGNGIVELGEVCDDGNLMDGDQCSFGCQSDGSCGNGFLDAMHGEECDDKNQLSHDGCTGTCVSERPAWSLIDTSQPNGLIGAPIAYDAIRNRLYMFGGETTGFTSIDQNQLWELDGDSWRAVDTPVGPPALVGASFTYDHDAKVSVLFGGRFQGSVERTTWLWNGSHWAYTNPTSQPRERHQHSAVYDVKNKRVIVVGGFGRNPPDQTDIALRDTWAWQAGNWTQICDACAPPARANAALGYDPVRGVVVMFGGDDGVSKTPLGDLWELDGSTWTQHMPASPPSPRKGAMMAYDVVSKQLVLHGGTSVSGSTSTVLDDTYLWNGSAWTHDTSGVARTDGALVADPVSERLVLFGGATQVPQTGSYPSETNAWSFNATANAGAWGGVGSALPPSTIAMAAATATYDFPRSQVLVYGLDSGGSTPATIVVDGTSFVTQTSSQPPARLGARVVTDLANGKSIVFGGFTPPDVNAGDSSKTLGDMWIWDGSWTQQTTGTKPSPRHSYAMASTRAGILMFGGCTDANSGINETWLWNGTWQKLSPATTPNLGLERSAMGYDPVRDRIVMFGGVIGNVLPDTWEWDGTNWTKINPPVSPPPRWGAELQWDAGRGRLVLYGGRRGPLDYRGFVGIGSDFRDAWEYDGATWTQLDIQDAPLARFDFAAIPTSHGVTMFGGIATTASEDFNQLRWQGLGADESCGPIDSDGDGKVGCDDPDCWARCTPVCPPGAPSACLANTPRCGDGTCSLLENHRICPADCGAAPVRCGDFVCDANETCPGECP